MDFGKGKNNQRHTSVPSTRCACVCVEAQAKNGKHQNFTLNQSRLTLQFSDMINVITLKSQTSKSYLPLIRKPSTMNILNGEMRRRNGSGGIQCAVCGVLSFGLPLG